MKAHVARKEMLYNQMIRYIGRIYQEEFLLKSDIWTNIWWMNRNEVAEMQEGCSAPAKKQYMQRSWGKM